MKESNFLMKRRGKAGQSNLAVVVVCFVTTKRLANRGVTA